MENMELGTVATICFACALFQSLLSGKIRTLSERLEKTFPPLSRLLHFNGEPEIVFGIWAAIFLTTLMISSGFEAALEWMDGLNFSEVIFVFVIMILASTKAITEFAESIIKSISKVLPLPPYLRFYCSILVMGPLLGSLITEPAAMTISAILLKRATFRPLKGKISDRLFYSTLAILFVNVSVGGSLTHFAAPPVLMVARTWEWDTAFMFVTFGWKAIISVFLNTAVAAWINHKELSQLTHVVDPTGGSIKKSPMWVTLVHLIFITLCVLAVHHQAFLVGLFLFFLGFYDITQEHQSKVKIEESLLVGFFLGGLVILTAKQGWWLTPILSSAESLQLYLGTLFLAPITDNAAITALAAQVPSLSETSKYLIVAAAVVGGGMTIIANAPNPAGFALLRDFCPGKKLKPQKLFLLGAIPTAIAGSIFWFF